MAVTRVGGLRGLCRNARPLLFRRERARAHTRTRVHIHPYIDTRTYPPLPVKSIYFIYILLLFPSLSVKRYRRGNLFGRIYGEEQSNILSGGVF